VDSEAAEQYCSEIGRDDAYITIMLSMDEIRWQMSLLSLVHSGNTTTRSLPARTPQAPVV
jgi:hypothetical protein